MHLLGGFAEISIVQIGTVAAMALAASLVGGVAGYGTGVLMPLVLVPIAGAEAIVPIIAISALFTNSSRAAAFRRDVDWRRAITVLACAAPTCMLGAYGFTLLTGRGALIVIGLTLILSVPVRRLAKRRGLVVEQGGLAAGSVLYGVLVGGTTGSGVILLSLLMAAGLQGAQVIATDAVISIVLGIVKVAVFGIAGAITPKVVAFALIIGAIAFPGAFLAKALVDRMPVHVHTAMLDVVVVTGGLYLIASAALR
ncbi:MAG TPA: sulfite exporter TauE/SafE family protein [Xanthobacteraceae bacterium]|nr:sulfite exporter TauE/SafE family protein [Xanthobacteraceae bacterium]